MISTPTPSANWEERYETLRFHVLDDRPVLNLEPLGFVLWLAQGMAGWMDCWVEAVAAPRPSPAIAPPSRTVPTSSFWQQQLTLLLAHITIQHLYPAALL